MVCRCQNKRAVVGGIAKRVSVKSARTERYTTLDTRESWEGKTKKQDRQD